MKLFRITLNSLLVVAFALAYAVSIMTHDHAELWPEVSPETAERVQSAREGQPVNIPEWTTETATAFPECARFTQPKILHNAYVVTMHDGRTIKMDTHETLTRGTNDNDADDVWIIGQCD